MRDQAYAIRNLITEHLDPPATSDAEIAVRAGKPAGNFMRSFDRPAREGTLPSYRAMRTLQQLLGVEMHEVLRAAILDAGLEPAMEYDSYQTAAAKLITAFERPEDRKEFVEILHRLIALERRDRDGTCRCKDAPPPPE